MDHEKKNQVVVWFVVSLSQSGIIFWRSYKKGFDRPPNVFKKPPDIFEEESDPQCTRNNDLHEVTSAAGIDV